MKTRTAICGLVALCLLLGPLALPAKTGDIWIQLNMASNMFNGELWYYVPTSYTTSKNGGGTGMQMRTAFEFSSGVTLGLSVEYHQIQDREVKIGSFYVPLTAQAIPVLISYQQYAGQLFFMVEAGACGWNGDKGGINPAAAFGGGYTIPMSDWFNFNISARALAVFSSRLMLPLSFSAGMSFIL